MSKLFLPLLVTQVCLSSLTMVNAATLVVLPGESIQAQIDASSAGDIVAIFGGNYSEDITINKAIRLVEVSGQEVSLLGDVTFDGVTDAPPFEGFTVGSSGKNITVTDTTGFLLREIDHSAGNVLKIDGDSENATIIECTLSSFDHDAGVVEFVDSTMSGSIDQNGGDSLRITNVTVGGSITQRFGSLHTSNVTVGGSFTTTSGAVRTIAFRTTVNGGCDWASNRCWFGYSMARFFNFNGSNAKVVIVASTIDRADDRADGVRILGSDNEFHMGNSVIKNIRALYTTYFNGVAHPDTWEHGVYITGTSKCIIQNCLVEMNHESGAAHAGIETNQTNTIIRNNVFSNCLTSVSAPFGTRLENNLLNNSSSPTGGVTNTNTLSGDPLFVDGDPYQLGEGSPCINAGTEDPRYNDRDGSRNDIGPSGGAWYDPDGWTTENPVVISFELSKDQILEGDATPILLQEGLGVSIP